MEVTELAVGNLSRCLFGNPNAHFTLIECIDIVRKVVTLVLALHRLGLSWVDIKVRR